LPTYEYVCESCGNQYEKREGFDAKPRQKCPACGKTAQRVLSAPAVVFKGSGFYKTDSRGSSSGRDSSSSPSSTSGTTPTTTPAADGGHTHGPGGHTHDTPAAPAAKPDTTSTSTETAAAS
jgi:putative FmdB family regulatory protein